MKHWMEVKIEVRRGIEDDVGAFLLSQGSHGVFIREKKAETFWGNPDTGEEKLILFAYFLTADEKMRILEGMKERFGRDVEVVSLSYLGDEELSESWKCYFRIVEVGDFAIVPSWMEYRGNKIPLKITCGLAFGTGTHPTTRTCAFAIQKYGRKLSPEKMLDAGCGSGILSIMGAKMGIKKCVGIDIDRRCVDTSRFNAMMNGVERNTEFIHCGIESLEGNYPFVVANIYHTIILELKEDILKRTEGGGLLILSGILENYRRKVLDEFLPFSSLIESMKEEGWVTLVLRKNLS